MQIMNRSNSLFSISFLFIVLFKGVGDPVMHTMHKYVTMLDISHPMDDWVSCWTTSVAKPVTTYKMNGISVDVNALKKGEVK
jgi:hypothetical protein